MKKKQLEILRANVGNPDSYELALWRPALGEDWPFWPYAVEETFRIGQRRFAESNPDVLIVSVVLDGALVYSFHDGAEHVVRPGEACVIPPGFGYSFRTEERAARYRKLVLELNGRLLSEICETLGFSKPLHFELKGPAYFERTIRALMKKVDKGCAAGVPAILARTFETLAALSLQGKRQIVSEPGLLTRAKALLESGPEGSRRVKTLAKDLGVCHSKLNRLFKKEIGMSPVKYRIQRKMEKAKRLLSRTGMSVKEVSQFLGYANQFQFSADFKRISGVSPKSFRKSGAGGGGEPQVES